MATYINKIALAAMFLLLSPTHVFVQGVGIEWDILNDEVMTLYRAGNYGRAVTVAKKALEVAEKNAGPDHPDVATSLENMAGLFRKTSRDKEADAFVERAARIRAMQK